MGTCSTTCSRGVTVGVGADAVRPSGPDAGSPRRDAARAGSACGSSHAQKYCTMCGLRVMLASTRTYVHGHWS
jgi:hypothetical protein